MLELELCYDAHLVPRLTARQVEELATAAVCDFAPALVQRAGRLDVDRFAESYLGLQQDFLYIDLPGRVLGATVFNDTKRFLCYDPVGGRAQFVPVRGGTVVIDCRLLRPGQEGRYRFTMAHELGHALLHGPAYGGSPGREPGQGLTAADIARMERQANAFASALLMPQAPALRLAERVNCLFAAAPPAQCARARMLAFARSFGVSRQAAGLRLAALGYEAPPLAEIGAAPPPQWIPREEIACYTKRSTAWK